MAVDSMANALALYPGTVAWMLDDATGDGTFDELARFAKSADGRVFLQRNPTPQGFLGVPVSMFHAYEWIHHDFTDVEMVIQLDPDACILRGGLLEFARDKFARSGPGQIGSYRIAPDGSIRKNGPHTRAILRDFALIGLDKKTRKLRFGLPFYWRFLLAAIRHGYRPGEHALAAFYILHGDTIRALGDAGFWRSIPREGSCNLKADDPLISLAVKAVGHALVDINVPSVCTWLQYKNPLTQSAEQIVAAGYLAIHPVKRDDAGRRLRADVRRLLGQKVGAEALSRQYARTNS